MKVFAFLIVVLICVAGIGFYRSWFAVSSSGPESKGNKVKINLTVDMDKVNADAATMKEKAAELTGQAKEGANEPVDQPKDNEKSDDE